MKHIVAVVSFSLLTLSTLSSPASACTLRDTKGGVSSGGTGGEQSRAQCVIQHARYGQEIVRYDGDDENEEFLYYYNHCAVDDDEYFCMLRLDAQNLSLESIVRQCVYKLQSRKIRPNSENFLDRVARSLEIKHANESEEQIPHE